MQITRVFTGFFLFSGFFFFSCLTHQNQGKKGSDDSVGTALRPPPVTPETPKSSLPPTLAAKPESPTADAPKAPVPPTEAVPATIPPADKPEGPDSLFLKKKRDQGIDFIATGTEPFWSLDMDFEKQFSFKLMDGISLNTPATKAEKAMDAPVTRYRAVVESGEIIITLQKMECVNQMSGHISPYSVRVQVRSSRDKDFKQYIGCGMYTAK